MTDARQLDVVLRQVPSDAPVRALLETAATDLRAGRADACVARLTGNGAELGGPGAFLLGLAYLRLGDLYRASAAFEQAAEADPGLHAAHVALGRLYVQQRDHARAASVLRRALELAPEDGPTLALLARSYLAVGRPRRAEALARRGLEIVPGDLSLRGALAAALRGQGRHGETVELLEAGPLDDETRVALGRSLLAVGRANDARPHFEAVLRRDGESVGALAGLAEVLEHAGRLAEARGYVLRALAAAPDVARMHLLSARIHLADNRLVGALRAAETALRLAPDDPVAMRLALRASLGQRRFGTAAEFADALLRQAPDDPEAVAALALQQVLDGQASTALGQLQAALEAEPQAGPLHRAAGCALLALGRPDEGAGRLAHALRLDPEDALAASALPAAYDLPEAPAERLAALAHALRSGPSRTTIAPRPPTGDVEVAVEALMRAEPAATLPEPPPRHQPATGPIPKLTPRDTTSPIAVAGALEAAIDLQQRLAVAPPPGVVGWPDLTDLRARLDHLITHHDEPLTVALMGPPGVGRTTLLNALAGQAVIPRGSRALHLIRHGRKGGARIIGRSGEVIDCPLGALAVHLAERPDPRRIEVMLPVDELRGVSIVDPPTGAEPPPADVAVWLVAADAPLEAWAPTAEWLRRQARPAIAALARADVLPLDALKRQLRAVHDHLDGRPLGVVGLAPEQGLAALQARDLKGLKASGLVALHRLLQGGVVQRADVLRDEAAARGTSLIRRDALARSRGAVARLERQAGEVGALSGRLTVDRANLRHELEAEAPGRLRAALRQVVVARAAELNDIQQAREPEVRERRVLGLRRRISAGFDQAVDAVSQALDDTLRQQLTHDFELLDEVYHGDPVAQARLAGLRATLDGYRALLLEQTFGRYKAFLAGWVAHAPLMRWASSAHAGDPAATLASVGLRLDAVPPLDAAEFAATLLDGLTGFVQQTARALEASRAAVAEALVDTLAQGGG
ncbi:MAG: tetratricopeptide repeat protein [Myxococcales bacterium]|nr:tetratricopeptide repeat protein [Myxococcales bacterium]